VSHITSERSENAERPSKLGISPRRENQVKSIKAIGLVALAALMAMAFAGASSALAESTQLCGHDGTPCEAIHHIHETSVGKAKLLTSIGTTECTALYLGDVSSFGATATVVGNFTYSGCTLGGSNCTATEENGPSTIKVEKTGAETTKVTGEGLVHLVCGSSIDCSYTGTGLIGTGKGALKSLETNPNGEVTLSEQKTTKEAGGFLCPKESKLDITTTPLSKTYILATEELGYCVKTEHKVGIYTDEKCATVGKNEKGEILHEWTYALVFAPKGSEVGKVLCYGTLLPFGLWAEKVSGTCQKDDTTQKSLYEIGTITLVE
jgi:hypothetical protein